MICNEKTRAPWEKVCCFCSCIPSSAPYKKDDETLDHEERLRRGIPSYLEGGPKYTNLIDDGRSIGLCERPIRVGGSILLCGRRNSRFPNQCMIGPDWPCTVLVYVLVIGAHAIVLSLAAPCLGWPVLMLGLIGFCVLMWLYSAVACTNPGMVLKMAPDSYTPYRSDVPGQFVEHELQVGTVAPEVTSQHSVLAGVHEGQIQEETGEQGASGSVDVEMGCDDSSEDSGGDRDGLLKKQMSTLSSNQVQMKNNHGPARIEGTGYIIESITGNTINTVGAVRPGQREVPCGHCHFDRPMYARHCNYCGACIDGLDHHCPWSGKCIGENNLKVFNWFVGFVCFEIYFIGGIFIYYLASCQFNANWPKGHW